MRFLLNTVNCRPFSYGQGELRKMRAQVERRLKVLEYYTEQKDFTYEPPEMYYDKKSGEIKIVEKKADPNAAKKKIIRNTDDLDRERKRLYKEEGLDEEGKMDKTEGVSVDMYAEKIKKVTERMSKELDIDPS